MISVNKFSALTSLSVLTLSALSICSVAETITLKGETVTYQYDDIDNAYALQLFGTPTIIGDDVRFLPTVFRAESLDGSGAGLLTANFVFSDVFTQSGADIDRLEVVEFGDYEIIQDGAVSADLLLTASSNRLVYDYTSDSDSFDASGASLGLQTWTLSAAIDPATQFVGAADNLAVSLQNTLWATSNEQGDISWIQKKLVFTATDSSQVPVPGAAWLFASALIGMASIGRRSKV